jgi:molybdate transport system ATP-binding protein
MITVTLQKQAPAINATFTCAEGITALSGPSGAGKSTLLQLIAGLQKPDYGRITIGTDVIFDSEKNINLPTHKRRIGLVFQDSLLFPHLSVLQNLRYGISDHNTSFEKTIAILELAPLFHRRPATLSGGERQRVAIGRALLASPRLLLMDEPLANLDDAKKQDILLLIKSLPKTFGLPVIYVSHASDEVAMIADKTLHIQQGQITT